MKIFVNNGNSIHEQGKDFKNPKQCNSMTALFSPFVIMSPV